MQECRYTNKKWYKDYEFVKSHENDYKRFFRLTDVSEEPIHMQDLGRAKTSEEAQKECDESPHFMSCLNTSLLSRQIVFPNHFGGFAIAHKLMCHPIVDFKGDVHLSESWLCPSVGNVTKEYPHRIWKNMTTFKPCLKCKGGKRFLESDRIDIAQARKVLGF